MKRLRFTDAKVRDLLEDAAHGREPFDRAPRVEFQDDVNPYLRARVSAGRCAWSVLAWHPQQRKAVRFQLGTHLTLNVKDARDAASAAVADMRGGVDLARERKEKRAVAERGRRTVRDMLDAYIAQCEEEGEPLRPATVVSYRHALPALLGEYFDRPVDVLDAAKMKALVIERSKKRTRVNARTGTVREVGSPNSARVACDALSRLCRVNRVADPTADLRVNWRGFPQQRARAGRLGEVEAQQLYAWLHDYQAGGVHSEYMTRQARMLMVALVTGWRALTVRQLRWEHIKWVKGTIELPADIMKNKKPLVVPLYETVAELLRPLKKDAGYVFANTRGEVSNFKDEFMASLPFECGPHDARKIVTLILSTREGVMPAVPKMLLGHSPGRGDVTFTHYLSQTPLPDRLRHMRAGADALDAFYRARVGDKKTIRAMDARVEPRRLAAVQRRRTHAKASRQRAQEKNRAIRAGATAS